MERESSHARMIAQYLLGELSEEEQSRFEEQYFADPDLFQQLKDARADLIDSYVRGELSEHERQRFEGYFLASPHRRERVACAQALVKKLGEATPPMPATAASRESGLWRQPLLNLFGTPRRTLVVVATTLVAILVAGWLIRESLQLREPAGGQETAFEPREEVKPQPHASQSPAQEASREQRVPEVSGPRSSSRSRIATILLTPSLTRSSDETAKLVIPPGTDLVQLRLDLEEDNHKNYRAVLRTPEGEQVWRQDRITAREPGSSKRIVLRLPANLFKNADYILSLSAVTATGEALAEEKYYFRAESR